MQQVNAFLAKGNKLYVTTGLIASLNNEEIRAVIAHEKGHEGHLNHICLQSLFVGSVNLLLIGSLRLITSNLVLAGSAFLILFFIRQFSYSKRHQFEFEADAYAAQECGAGAMVNGLVRLTRCNGLSFERRSATHPSTYDRIEALEVTSSFPRPRREKFPLLALLVSSAIVILTALIPIFTMLLYPQQNSLSASIELSSGFRLEESVAFLAADFVAEDKIADAENLLQIADEKRVNSQEVRNKLSIQLADRGVCDIAPTDYFRPLAIGDNEDYKKREISGNSTQLYLYRCGSE